jgi:uncharacterized membrane protein
LPTHIVLAFVQESAKAVSHAPEAGAVESGIATAVQWLRLGVETMGALVIGVGVIAASSQFIRALISSQVKTYNSIRLTLARYLALALELQLGADILSTAIAPGWQQIGKLGAIAVIRTGLNYFLTREMAEEVTRQNVETKIEATEGQP